MVTQVELCCGISLIQDSYTSKKYHLNPILRPQIQLEYKVPCAILIHLNNLPSLSQSLELCPPELLSTDR